MAVVSKRAFRSALVVACVIASFGIASAQPKIPFKSRELAEGRNFVQRLTPLLAVGESSGAVSYSYDFVLPPARLMPQLSLQYSSGGGNSEFGFGWELTVPMIERSSRHGMPNIAANFQADAFQFRNGQQVRELVATGVTVADGWQEYRETPEQSFTQYLRKDNQWRVLRTDGTRIECGTSTTSRRGSDLNALATTAAWLADKVVDTHSNFVNFNYSVDPAGNARLASILWGGNSEQAVGPVQSVYLNWVNHWPVGTPVPVSYRSGYKREFGRQRLASIIVNAPQHATTSNPAKIPTNSPTSRTYTFGYQASTGVALNNLFVLSSITEGSLPADNFTYANPWAAGTIDTAQEITVQTASGPMFPAVLGKSDTVAAFFGGQSASATTIALVDVNSDGKLDLIDASGCAAGNRTWTVWLNNPTGFIRTSWTLPPAPTSDSFGDPYPCAIRASEKTSSGTLTYREVMDFNGDGVPDLLRYRAPLTELCLGNGHGFDYGTFTCQQIANPWTSLRREWQTGGYHWFDRDLIDVNGDGRPDWVETSAANLLLRFNTPTGLLAPITAGAPPCVTGVPVTSCLRATLDSTGVQNGQTFNNIQLVELKDVNGDGLVDFLRMEPGAGFFVHFGSGGGFAAAASIAGGPTSLGVANSIGQESPSGYYESLNDLLDINADGLPDIVHRDAREGNTFTVRFNNGGTWDSTANVYTISAAPAPTSTNNWALYFNAALNTANESGQTVAQLVDISGDGIPDFVSEPQTFQPPESRTLLVRKLNYVAPRKLLNATSLNGNYSMAVTYAPQNGDVGNSPAYAIHAPVSIVRSRAALFSGESTRVTTRTTNYSYYGPRYDRDRQEFMSFASVTATDGEYGTVRTTDYGITFPVAGLPFITTSANLDGTGESETVTNTYYATNLSLSPQRMWVYLGRTVRAPSQSAARETMYVTYDEFGNNTEWIDGGLVSDGNDDITHTRHYVKRFGDGLFRFELPNEERTKLGTTLLSMSRTFYDDRLTYGTAPTRGDPVRTERAKSADPFPAVLAKEAFFDGYGNVTSTLDELSYPTSYTYDPTYHFYKVSTSNSVGTTYASYHALTGAAADACDMQSAGSATTTYNCNRREVDNIGRATKLYTSNLSGSTYQLVPLTTITYNDNAYPLSMEQITHGGRTVQYRDGFGNPVQVRVEETANTFRVFTTTYDATGAPLIVAQPYRDAGPAFGAGSITFASTRWYYTHDYLRGSASSLTLPQAYNDTSPPAVSTRVVTADLVTMTDEDGRVVKYAIDGFGRVKSVRRVDIAAGDAVWQFSYSPRGEVTDVTDPNGLVTHYDYDFLGRTTLIRSPDNGTLSFVYNNRSQVTQTTDARGVVVTTSYDTQGRVIGMLSSNEPAGVRRVNHAFQYYTATSPTYRGRLKGESNDGIVQEYSYTAEGAIWGHTAALSATQRGTVGFTYDPGKRLKQVIYPDGLIVNYTYNLDDSLKQVTDNTGHILASYLYDDAGRVNVTTNQYGLDEAYTFDLRGRMTQVASSNTAVAAGDLVDDRISWSKAGLVTAVQRYGLNVGGSARTSPDNYAMSYDSFGRLTNVTRNGAFYGGYEYDKADRLTRFQEGTVNNPTPTTYVQDKLTARVNGNESRSWTYDASGNATQDLRVITGATPSTRTRTHSYDALGRYVGFVEVGAAQTAYYYTPSGQLSRVTAPGPQVNSSDYLHVGPYARKDLTTGAWVDRVVGANGAVAELRGPRIEMAHKTFGQSVAAVSNDLGSILRQEEFKPYGKVTSSFQAASVGPTGGWEERFHGIRGDELMVAGGRAYDAERGSWLARDPLAVAKPSEVLGDVRIGAMYAFNYGDPIRFRDPTGRCPPCILIGIGIGLGAADAAYKGGGPKEIAIGGFSGGLATVPFLLLGPGAGLPATGAAGALGGALNYQANAILNGQQPTVRGTLMSAVAGTLTAVAFKAAGDRLLKTGTTVSNPPAEANLTGPNKTAITKIDNTINNNLQVHDYAGVVSERNGVPIPKPGGGVFNHVQEMQQSVTALTTAINSLQGSLQNPNLSQTTRDLIGLAIYRAQWNLNMMEAALNSGPKK